MVIVAAVDRSARAADVIGEAEALAEAFDDTVHVVHVLTNSEFYDMERSSVEETGKAVELDEIRAAAADIAADVAADLDIPSKAVGLIGNPTNRIVEYASEQDARYVVIAGRKRSPAGKAIFGSVAQSILLNADCPVLMSIGR